MDYKNILITGGAGFVGANIAIKLKEYFSGISVLCLDNLMRRGSELNVPRLRSHSVRFVWGDIRNSINIDSEEFDLLIECSAEPSVTAGTDGSPRYLLDTNLGGTVNCIEAARKKGADVIFLSTSRVYPFDKINALMFKETETRFQLDLQETVVGVSKNGISERFGLEGVRSMYGATKLASEYFLNEYVQAYGMKVAIIRFGVIAGPWQFGKVDQGVVTHWLVSHYFNKPLSYFGFGGKGKQVRDILHIDDVFQLILKLMENIKVVNGKVMNAGGSLKNSLSLLELTDYCQKIVGHKIPIGSDPKTRVNDVMWYVTDNNLIQNVIKWKINYGISQILDDTFHWLKDNSAQLKTIFN